MGLQAYKILVKKNWIKLSRCSRTELALYSTRSLGNHDASSATPTAAAIDQGLNKSSGEPTGCPRGSRPFSNELLRMTAKHKRFSIIYINMYEPELGVFSSRSAKERPKKDRLSVIRPEWKPHDTFDGIEKRENLCTVDVTCEWTLWCRFI